MSAPRKLRMGMVGGGRDAFIGAVHRHAAALDGQVDFVAGALSSTPEKALASAADLGLAPDRSYPTWEAMLEGERRRPAGERIDFVSIVTPNHVHYPVAKAFAEAGINVVSDKPLVHTSQQARELVNLTRETGIVFAVTYNYTGYPLVKEARHLIQSGQLGEVQKVIVEYNQGWLVTRQEEQGSKQAEWRTDPQRSGIAGAVGDIGSHAENLVATVTGLKMAEICADLTTFAPGRKLDDDGNLLLRFEGGARGLLFCSQISTGEENDLRLRVYGTRGALCWHQEEPNVLAFTPLNEPTRLLRRGNGYLSGDAQRFTRTPSGHPEAFLEAFANVYLEAIAAMRAREAGEKPGAALNFGRDFPTVLDGARGVHFIETTVESAHSSAKWTPARFEI
ncbi:MAG TPA: Gfo/Idh/MocA family oxidoreductase [Deinococcales bacterium]|nr:Gfo/Idh/MocA family oxidoreductase [Deinococcales bacterium]